MLLAIVTFLACAHPVTTSAAEAAPFVGAHTTPADITDLPVVTSPSGLSWYVLKEGVGLTAMAGQEVQVNYVGFLAAGGKFDASYDRGRPFTFRLGAGRVIPGWDEGVAGMKVGEQRQLHIPAKLGYGSRGAGGIIPPDADLIFDVELVQVR